ncbi:DUF2567 domain-containing protein [Modestobacter sp. L9-4]|uniref:DUF2567 domain-containing protein n=1 Tax=Modestobacter sp. L9-4 TaxID=2851567 RepID=UPI001C775306|nr:DUF2567 domain-containing protein [Modestobacter sp. L9-4]QXG75785.1 DUF2567 domain-containing protein [Modestobacter sp. L9-4]
MTDPRSAGPLPPFPARPGSAGGPDPAPGTDTEQIPTGDPQPFPASGPQPFPASGPQPFPASGPQPSSASGPQPSSASGPQPFPASGPQPFPASGPQPVSGPGQPASAEPFGAHPSGVPLPGAPSGAESPGGQPGGVEPVGEPGPPVPPWAQARRAGVPGLRGSRQDLRTGLLTVLVLALSGLPAGALWLWLAPRADYRVTETDVVPVSGLPNSELFMSDDGVFVLVLAALGLLAGLVVWRLRSRRGALLLTALATGVLAAGVVAWQLGAWLGAGPTEADLTEVGRTVTTGLGLRATAALAVGPFLAVVVYLVAATYTSRQDLGRPEPDDQPLRLPLPPVPPPAT